MRFLPALLLLLMPDLVYAHPLGSDFTFNDGLTHPLTGIEHFLAMLSIGLLSAQMGGKAIWKVPAAFVLVMAPASLLGMYGYNSEYGVLAWVPVKTGITASVIVLGFAIFRSIKFPQVVVYSLTALFATCHGYLHGAGATLAITYIGYTAGFMLTTAGIHVLGAIIGIELSKSTKREKLLNLLGLPICLYGGYILVADYPLYKTYAEMLNNPEINEAPVQQESSQ